MAGRVTGSTVVVSTIGVALRQRGIGVGELQRRLAERGIRVSRGALDRLASDRPLKAINFELLLPILEELGITLGEPFVALPNDELERQQAARALGREAARNLANGDATGSAVAALVDEADLADDDSIDRLDATEAARAGSAMNARDLDMTIRTVAAVLWASERSSAKVSAHWRAPAARRIRSGTSGLALETQAATARRS